MRRIALGTLAAFATMATPASAERTACNDRSLKRDYSAHYYAVKSVHGTRAPGRNVRKWGISAKRRSTCKQIAKSLRILRTMRFRGAGLLAPGSPRLPPARVATLRAPSGGVLQRIAQCESGGNIRAIGGGGSFRGKYQFMTATWRSVGGTGDPAAASEAEQDKRAAILYAREGARPWPVCGR